MPEREDRREPVPGSAQLPAGHRAVASAPGRSSFAVRNLERRAAYGHEGSLRADLTANWDAHVVDAIRRHLSPLFGVELYRAICAYGKADGHYFSGHHDPDESGVVECVCGWQVPDGSHDAMWSHLLDVGCRVFERGGVFLDGGASVATRLVDDTWPGRGRALLATVDAILA